MLAAVFFLVWMLFIDENNFINQYRKRAELKSLIQKKNFYKEQIEQTNNAIAELNGNSSAQEKFAREHYFMKKENEEVFVIVKEKSKN